jgi:hypothetical protein
LYRDRGEEARAGFVRPLGEAGASVGLVGDLDRLAGAGLPVPEGFVLTGEAHRVFMRRTGMTDGFDRKTFEPPRKRSFGTLGEELDASVREALISLSAAKVMVRFGEASRRGLGTIPTVLSAIRGLWLRPGVLDPRAKAPSGGVAEFPTLIQREARPERILQATREKLGRMELTPSEREWMSYMILEAEYMLGGPLSVQFGLEEGRWYIASVGKDTRTKA